MAKGVLKTPVEDIETTCARLDGLMDRMQLKAEGKVVEGDGGCNVPSGPVIAACQPAESKLMYFRPHDGYAKGCPNPPCYEERFSTAQGVHKHMELHDGELGEHRYFRTL